MKLHPAGVRQRIFVFDVDGVVCPGGPFTAALEKHHGIPAASLQPFFHGVFRECIVGTRDLREVMVPYLPEWGWGGTVDEFLAFWFQQENRVAQEVVGCARALRERGHRCVLGTNQEKYRAAYLWDHMKLSERFDGIFPSCDLGAAKPSPEYFAAIQKRLGAPASGFLLIDDQENNVTGAQAAGWDAIHFKGIEDVDAVLNAAM